MVSNLDGTGKRIIFKRTSQTIATGQAAVTFSNLKEHNGYLYVLVGKTPDRTSADKSHPASLLRYKPGGPEELRTAYEFREHVVTTTFYDEDYYYYDVLEERENWFSFSDIYIKRVPVLFRQRLPG